MPEENQEFIEQRRVRGGVREDADELTLPQLQGSQEGQKAKVRQVRHALQEADSLVLALAVKRKEDWKEDGGVAGKRKRSWEDETDASGSLRYGDLMGG